MYMMCFMNQIFEKMLGNWYKFERSRQVSMIRIGDEGLQIKHPWTLFGHRKEFMQWVNVKEIHAQLLDCYTAHVLFLTLWTMLEMN